MKMTWQHLLTIFTEYRVIMVLGFGTGGVPWRKFPFFMPR